MKIVYTLACLATGMLFLLSFESLASAHRTLPITEAQAFAMQNMMQMMLAMAVLTAILVGMICYSPSTELYLSNIANDGTVYEIVCAKVWNARSVTLVIRKSGAKKATEQVLRIVHSDEVDYRYGPEELLTPNAAQYRFTTGSTFRCELELGKYYLNFVTSVEKPALV